MRADNVIASLLNVAAVTAIVGNRLARQRLPQNSTYPAAVYELISATPVLPITANAGANITRAIVQINCLARKLDDMDALVEAVRVACSFKAGSIAGVQVISVVPAGAQPLLRDDDVSVFYQSMDFDVTYVEA